MEVITVGEAAKILGIPRYRLVYAAEMNKIPQPRRSVMGHHRYYLREDVDEIRKVLLGTKGKEREQIS